MPDIFWYGNRRVSQLTITTGPLLLPDGTVAAPSLAWTAFPATGFYRSGSNIIGFSVAGADKMAFTSALLGVSTWDVRWANSSSDPLGTADLYLQRSAAGHLKVTTDGDTALGTVSAGKFTTTGTAGPTQSAVASYYVGASFYQTAGFAAATDLQYATGFAMYCKGSRLVIAYNNAGNQARYKTILLDGATTSWVDTATAP